MASQAAHNGSDAWLEFGMAAFLMVQGEYCYFGAAANWYDQDWKWHAQYDWKVGRPLGPAGTIAWDLQKAMFFFANDLSFQINIART